MAELSIVIVVILSILMKIDTKSVVYKNVNNRPEAQEDFDCDKLSRRKYNMDGLISENKKTPWLGVLVVYITEFGETTTAVTGIVLVKFNYAIGNTHDIVRVPEKLLRSKSKATFTPANKGEIQFNVGRTLVHDEYRKGIHNTISIIELIKDKFSFEELKPICLLDINENNNVHASFDTVHTFGYTDDYEGNFLQEVYKIEQVENAKCVKYYNRNALSSKKLWPSNFYCCEEVSKNRSEVCIYDNGMVLASDQVKNKEGIWMLLGISTRGPGCSAPSRFINIAPYTKWIRSILRNDQRTIKQKEITREVVDINDFNAMSGRRFQDSLDHKDYYRIVDFDRVSDTKLALFVFNNTWRYMSKSCDHKRTVIYRENTTIETLPGKSGIGVYKISLFDMLHEKYTCVKLELDVADRSPAQLYYTIGQDEKEDTNEEQWDQPYVLDITNYKNQIYLNVYVRFVFRGRADLKIAFFGPLKANRNKNNKKVKIEDIKQLIEMIFWRKLLQEANAGKMWKKGSKKWS